MASEGGRWRVVDASKSKEEVGAEVWAVVMGFLKSRAVGLLGI
jgi:thymidylate kinase